MNLNSIAFLKMPASGARKMHVQLAKGEEIDSVLQRIYGMPKDIVERVMAAVK